MASLPESVRTGGALAAVGDTAIYAFIGNQSPNFYCYDLEGDSWVQKQSALWPISQGAALTWDGGEWLYAVRGCSTNYHNELLKYSIAGDSWSLVSTSPINLGAYSDMVYGGGGFLYALQGGYDVAGLRRFLRYEIAGNQGWEALEDVPEGCAWGSLVWDQDSHIYVVVGADSRAFYQYDIVDTSWSEMDSLPFPAGHYPQEYSALAYCSLDGRIYCMWDESHFYKYDEGADTWMECTPPPWAFNNGDFDEGGALASCGEYVYCLLGDGTGQFFRYAPDILPGESRLAAAVDEPSGPLGITACRLDVSPNPARGAAHVQWATREPGLVTLRVFDNIGRVVRTIQNGYQPAGRYSARWDGVCDDGRRAAKGVFFCRLDAPGFHKIVKVVTVGR
jgi:hypothetical protein